MPAIASPAGPQSNGFTSSHITPVESEVDRLWDHGGGFESFGEYVRAAAVMQSAGNISPSDGEAEKYRRWAAASRAYRHAEAMRIHHSVTRAISTPDGMFELTDPDGGSVIPPAFIKEVFDKARFRDTPLSRCRIVGVAANAGVMPAIRETSRVDGSRWGGLLSYWEGEAQQLTATHPTLRNNQYRLKKLTALVPASEELFQDSGLLDAFIGEVVPKEFAFQTNETMINGNGAGRPLGVVNAPCTITIAKDTGQATGTLSATNIQNMWTQFHGPSRAEGVWYAQEDIDPDTLGLMVTQPTAWGGPQPCPHVKGRPFLPLENCQPIGTSGDVVLGDWSQYLLLLAAVRKSLSMHFKFDYFEGYFKFIWRCDGQPLWDTTLTPPHSTIVKSPFLVLAKR